MRATRIRGVFHRRGPWQTAHLLLLNGSALQMPFTFSRPADAAETGMIGERGPARPGEWRDMAVVLQDRAHGMHGHDAGEQARP